MSKVFYENSDILSGGYVHLENLSFWKGKKRYYVGTSYILCDHEMAHKYDGDDLVLLNNWDNPGRAIRKGIRLIVFGVLCKIRNLKLSSKDV